VTSTSVVCGEPKSSVLKALMRLFTSIFLEVEAPTILCDFASAYSFARF
jgi:hypothetical protein